MSERVVHSAQARPLSAFLNPPAMVRGLWSHRGLIWQLAKRDVQARYKEARLGLLWSILTPLALLAIYTFVFAVVFQFRWTDDVAESRGVFALTMFCGMLLYNLFAEVANRSPSMIVHNPNYVKKVIFPLEVFVVSGLISALINMSLGYAVWIVGWVLIEQSIPHWTIVWCPLVVLPVCLTALGVGWILASVGVFLRDVGHAVALGTQMLFFMTPIFYSMDRVPERYRWVMQINPLAHAVEDVRRVLLHGRAPEWQWWVPTLIGSGMLAVVGYAFFMKSKRAFADVV